MPGSCLSLSPVEEGAALGEEGWSHESDTQPPVAVHHMPGCPPGTSQQRCCEKFGLISMGPFSLPFAVPVALSVIAFHHVQVHVGYEPCYLLLANISTNTDLGNSRRTTCTVWLLLPHALSLLPLKISFKMCLM